MGAVVKPIASFVSPSNQQAVAKQVIDQQVKTTSPTTAEVDQASATDASGIKRRRRGRSPTILTGSAGVQEGATLGSPTLLG
jgi:hypothetical protein